MDAAFAEFAWSNDQRISKLTGQQFSEAYRQKVLGNHGSRFDSSAATLALTAVRLSEPSREFEVLTGFQEARYVGGINTCDALAVEKLLRDWGLENAADTFAANDVNLIASNAKRIEDAGSLLQSHGAQGVPALVIKDHLGERLVAGNALYTGIDALLNDVAQS
jgi:putative protein-disulfide isomerase